VTTIQIDTPTGPIEALLDTPAGPGPHPGVVIIHDAMGFASDKEQINRRVAAAGYLALTPNLFSRGGWARCVAKVMGQLAAKEGQALDDILAARDHLKALPECTGKVGIAGFCMGGGFALVMSPKGFDASAPFYGAPLPKQLSETLDGACPIVASYGGRDPVGIGAPKKLQRVLDEKGIPNDVKAYSKAGHSFANKLPAQPLLRITGFGYNQEATEDAWARVFSFFGEHMGSNA
jgi:carboxymethylenebutenolidase